MPINSFNGKVLSHVTVFQFIQHDDTGKSTAPVLQGQGFDSLSILHFLGLLFVTVNCYHYCKALSHSKYFVHSSNTA